MYLNAFIICYHFFEITLYFVIRTHIVRVDGKHVVRKTNLNLETPVKYL